MARQSTSVLGPLAVRAGKAAGRAVVKRVNGGCPGSDDGKHSFKHDRDLGTTYCKNRGCGRLH